MNLSIIKDIAWDPLGPSAVPKQDVCSNLIQNDCLKVGQSTQEFTK